MGLSPREPQSIPMQHAVECLESRSRTGSICQGAPIGPSVCVSRLLGAMPPGAAPPRPRWLQSQPPAPPPMALVQGGGGATRVLVCSPCWQCGGGATPAWLGWGLVAWAPNTHGGVPQEPKIHAGMFAVFDE